jgi:hypothetical protein
MALRLRKTRLRVSRLKNSLLFQIPGIPKSVGKYVTRETQRTLVKGMKGEVKITNDTLDFLMMAMDLAFSVMKDYRENIKNFDGCYEFETRKGNSKSGAIFKDGRMKVVPEGILFPDAKVRFEDFKSLWKYIFSKDQELLDLILENKIEMEGNTNLLFKFCFMVKDLKQRFGLET